MCERTVGPSPPPLGFVCTHEEYATLYLSFWDSCISQQQQVFYFSVCGEHLLPSRVVPLVDSYFSTRRYKLVGGTTAVRRGNKYLTIGYFQLQRGRDAATFQSETVAMLQEVI